MVWKWQYDKSTLFLGILSMMALSSCDKDAESNPYPSVLQDFIDDPSGAVITDFSYAGYHHGSELPPVRKDLPYFSVLDYGAVPNDGMDDISAIQAAIDAAGEAGGGVVLFPSGTFDFDVQDGGRFLHIKHSNVILRGNGSEIQGTIFHDHSPSRSPDPAKKWLAGLYPGFVYAGTLPSDSSWHVGGGNTQPLTAVDAAPRHAMTLQVEHAGRLREGQTYLLTQHDSDSSLAYELAYPLRELAANHLAMEGARKYRFQNLISIESISGNTVTLSAPILWDLKAQWKPQLWELPELLLEVGVEAIRMRTEWSDTFIHHLNDVHDNGWDHIRFSFTKDSYVRNIVHENATTAVSLSNAVNCVVMDGQITGNPGHNGFNVNGFSTHNLLINLIGGQQMHTFSIQGHASGNVFSNCYADERSAIDCHGGLGVYNLFDGIFGCVFKNGGSGSNVPPAMGNKLIFWNLEMGYRDPYNGRVRPTFAKFSLIPGFVAVGVRRDRGQPVIFKDENGKLVDTDMRSDWGIIERPNERVVPYSLYRFQSERRLNEPTKSD